MGYDWSRVTMILKEFDLAKELKQRALITDAEFNVIKIRLNEEAHKILGL